MNTFVADPHWGWWIVWYFYLGGIAAGAYFLAALVEFVGDEQDRRISRVGYLLAAPLVAVCGVLLILDLDQPTRFWHMLFDAETLRPHVKYWSPMSIGAWALLLFGAVSTVSFVGAVAEAGWCGLGRWCETARRLHQGIFGRAFDLIGTVCGFFIASYTGALLTATNQPVWSDSPWIAAMFLASSASTGIAAVTLIAFQSPANSNRIAMESSAARFERMESWVLAIEFVFVVLFLVSLGAPKLRIISWVPLVLGTLGAGVCVPLVFRRLPRFLGKATPAISAVLVLAGGLVLRYSILAAAPAVLEQAEVNGHASILEGRSDRAVSRRTEPRPSGKTDAIEELLTLVRERLDLMHDVARAKWRERRPIEDVEREQALLRAMQDEAVSRGIPPAAVSTFFQTQIRAAKRVQQAYFDEWSRDPPSPENVPDLANDVRPKLDSLNMRLLDALARTLDSLTEATTRAEFRRRGEESSKDLRLSESERTELLDGLLESIELATERTDDRD
jgi:chorismate mutase-like protein